MMLRSDLLTNSDNRFCSFDHIVEAPSRNVKTVNLTPKTVHEEYEEKISKTEGHAHDLVRIPRNNGAGGWDEPNRAYYHGDGSRTWRTRYFGPSHRCADPSGLGLVKAVSPVSGGPWAVFPILRSASEIIKEFEIRAQVQQKKKTVQRTSQPK